MTESLDIELDIEECVPTVRINPDAYRAMVNEQEHARTPITKRVARQTPITRRCAVPEGGQR